MVSVVGNIVPQGRDSHDSEPSRRATGRGAPLAYRLFPLCRDMLGLATNPIPIKAAMQMLGRDTGELRMPLWPLSPAEEAKLRATLVEYGLPEKVCRRAVETHHR